MTDGKPETPEAIEAEDMGERPDLGRTPDALADALADALTGSGVGSDTRAGSLQGGAATGSDDDPDQTAVDRVMADQGRASADPQSPSEVDPNGIANTGVGPDESDADPAEGRRPADAEAATG
ncbi:ribonuclease [Brevundimonas sp. SL161]|uniref:ribonuclease n=1 Tax=Brevundimonas sp. SL161 TaxID=2804613 RepID=UPI003CEF3D79